LNCTFALALGLPDAFVTVAIICAVPLVNAPASRHAVFPLMLVSVPPPLEFHWKVGFVAFVVAVNRFLAYGASEIGFGATDTVAALAGVTVIVNEVLFPLQPSVAVTV
jgi:hypothetical protein